ncbi:hypothetical protein NHX12_026124, partial [Muraenolepis orangiensis]
MESHETPVIGQKCTKKDKAPLQRAWASEPSASSKRSTFSVPDVTRNSSCEGQSCDEATSAASGAQSKYPSPGKLRPAAQDPQGGTFPQGFPRGYAYQPGQPYPQHPHVERFLSGAKPQPGLEAHAWPFAGQLPSDELYPAGHSGTSHRAAAAGGRFPRQKSPSLPSSFGQYSQLSSESGEEGYGKKDQKLKKPGKYICHYCGRACAKPSVLKKHIRSHTGERPFPCTPCGFSFKTKSNLYKHRKSHAHAIKAGLVSFSEMGAGARGGDLDQASLADDVHSDGEQSTDTDEEGLEGVTMLMDKDSPEPHISFNSDSKRAGAVEPAYADAAEQLSMGSMMVPILIVPKPGGVPLPEMECPSFPDMKGLPHHMPGSQAGALGNTADDSPTIEQRLAMRLKQGQEPDSTQSQTQNLLSPHSKGSTDSGYFSRSEEAEQPISPPNTNIKSYEEIIYGRTWNDRPNSRSRQSITVSMASAMGQADPSSLASIKKSGVIQEMGKIAEDHIFFKGEGGVSGDPKQYATVPCQSITGMLLEPPSDSATLIRSNSMPTSSPTNLSVPNRVQGSQSFDEMMTSDDVFYAAGSRRLQRQAAFEHAVPEAHAVEAEAYGHVPKNVVPSMSLKMGERSPGLPEHIAYSPYGTKVGMSEIVRDTRKRRKKESVGEEEDSFGQYDSSCSGSVDMIGDYDSKQGSLDGSRGTPTGKGSLYSAHSQSDSFDTCASICSDDMALLPDSEGRKAAGNVISVIQHTNSLSRPNSFEKSESFDQLAYHPADKALCSQFSEQSETDIFEDAQSPESTMQRTQSMEQQPQSDGDLPSISSSAAASPGQPYHIPHKLVRQPNIQVPEIRVTEEPDKPEKEAEAVVTCDLDRQMPSEKLPPKKKRLRLADMDHSSGESSFESTCTSLSRSPSQESNLSYYSSFSMSFDREENLKSVSPTKQEDALCCCGTGTASKQSEFLTVPGSGHSSHHQQREMRRSSSEQAPCALATEFPEMRSKSFDYGSLTPGSRQGEMYSSASAMKERRRGYLVRQASLSVYPEGVPQESCVKPDGSEHGSWPGQGGPGQVGSELHLLQQSISEDSLQDGPTNQRPTHHRLQRQSSSMDSLEPQGQEVATYQPHQPPGAPFWASEGPQRPRIHHGFQAPQHYPNPHARAPANSQSEGSSLSQMQTLFAAHTLAGCQVAAGVIVPVRVHTHVPSYGSATYTSATGGISGVTSRTGFNLLHFLGHSLELFFQTKQQKCVKEERMYGQIVRDMSAVELKSEGGPAPTDHHHGDGDQPERMTATPPAVPHLPPTEDFNPERCGSAQSMASSSSNDDEAVDDPATAETPWCFLNYATPSSREWQAGGATSVYASWRVSGHDPNPLSLSTKAALALLRSRQRQGGGGATGTYTTAATGPPSTGKLVSSVSWRLRFDQLKPELMPVEVCKLVRKMKGVVSRERSKEEQGEREVSSKAGNQPAEPTRIKIFEGGYKSNEDYVYVRGRGRGKYICEECGIRCKKPSMLKKHIRTHTDVRPYVCKFCNFAFKTKGNLTKHMKSKAHMKKCLELGVEDIDTEDAAVEEGQRASGKAPTGGNHQFSDADDSDGGEDDGEEVDEDEDDEDDYDGDSTPKSRSRSTSPLPYGPPSPSVTSVAASHQQPAYCHPSLLGGGGPAGMPPPPFGYFTTVPSIRITPQAGAGQQPDGT